MSLNYKIKLLPNILMMQLDISTLLLETNLCVSMGFYLVFSCYWFFLYVLAPLLINEGEVKQNKDVQPSLIFKMYSPAQTFLENAAFHVTRILDNYIKESPDERNEVWLEIQKIKADQQLRDTFKNFCYDGRKEKYFLPDGETFQLSKSFCNGIEFPVNVTISKPIAASHVTMFVSLDGETYYAGGESAQHSPLEVNKNVTITICGSNKGAGMYFLVACAVNSSSTFQVGRVYKNIDFSQCVEMDDTCGGACTLDSFDSSGYSNCKNNRIVFQNSTTRFSSIKEDTSKTVNMIFTKLFYYTLMLSIMLFVVRISAIFYDEANISRYLDHIPFVNFKGYLSSTAICFMELDYTFIRCALAAIISASKQTKIRKMRGVICLCLDNICKEKYQKLLGFVELVQKNAELNERIAPILRTCHTEKEFFSVCTDEELKHYYKQLKEFKNGTIIIPEEVASNDPKNLPNSRNRKRSKKRKDFIPITRETDYNDSSKDKHTNYNSTHYKYDKNFTVICINPKAADKSSKPSKIIYSFLSNVICLEFIITFIDYVKLQLQKPEKNHKDEEKKPLLAEENKTKPKGEQGVGKAQMLEYARKEVVGLAKKKKVKLSKCFFSIVDVRHAVFELFYPTTFYAFFDENGKRIKNLRAHQIAHYYALNSKDDIGTKSQRVFFLYINFFNNLTGCVTSSGNCSTQHLRNYSDGEPFTFKTSTITEDANLSIKFLSKGEKMTSSAKYGCVLGTVKTGFGFFDSLIRWCIGNSQNGFHSRTAFVAFLVILAVVLIHFCIVSIPLYFPFDGWSKWITYYSLLTLYYLCWLIMAKRSRTFQLYLVIFSMVSYPTIGAATCLIWNLVFPIAFAAGVELVCNPVILVIITIISTGLVWWVEWRVRYFQKKDGTKHGPIISEADHINSFRMFIISVPQIFCVCTAVEISVLQLKSWVFKHYQSLYLIFLPLQQLIYIGIVIFVPLQIIWKVRLGVYILSDNISQIFAFVMAAFLFTISFPSAYLMFLSIFKKDPESYTISPKLFSTLVIILLSVFLILLFYQDISFLAVG